MKKLFWIYGIIGLAGTLAYSQVSRDVRNRAQDEDTKVCVNDGGTEDCPLVVDGPNGNVGINTDSPSSAAQLHVLQTVAGGSDGVIVEAPAGNTTAEIEIHTDGANVLSILAGSDGNLGGLAGKQGILATSGEDLHFWTDGSVTDKLRVNADGSLGVTANAGNAAMTFQSTTFPNLADGATLYMNISGNKGAGIIFATCGYTLSGNIWTSKIAHMGSRAMTTAPSVLSTHNESGGRSFSIVVATGPDRLGITNSSGNPANCSLSLLGQAGY
jgi:hypothetical protein